MFTVSYNRDKEAQLPKMADDLASRSLALVIFEGSSLVILNLLSLAGNIMVCLSVYRNPRLRTPTNLYIIALAVSDLLSAVFVMPLSETILFTGKWSFGETICQFHAFMSSFVIYVSSATMGLTAVNRYVRICKPNTTYQKIFSPRKSRLWVIFVWLFVACYVAIPQLAKLQDFEFVPGYALCSLKHLGEKAKLIHYIIVLPIFLSSLWLSQLFVTREFWKLFVSIWQGFLLRWGDSEGTTRAAAFLFKKFDWAGRYSLLFLPFWHVGFLSGL